MTAGCTVAIFHASFHPTQGNVVDWNLKASNGAQGVDSVVLTLSDKSLSTGADIDLDGVEFNVLPSGLHLVERDTL